MPQNNFIRNLLGITDKNITFPDLSEEDLLWIQKKSVKAKVIPARLTYTPLFCENCGFENTGASIVKYGGKTSDIQLNKTNETKTFLRLWKQRFMCRNCQSTFSAKTGLVDSHCFISKNVKFSIARDLQEKSSLTYVAKKNEASPTTVARVMDDFYQEFQVDTLHLPEALCFDEFKAVKNVAGKMSFIYMDAQTKKVIDIVANRQLNHLETYFHRFPLEVRKRVKWIVIDMYAPYKSLIKSVFPHAQIIVDRFHIVQHISRAMNQTRIRVMNSFCTKDKEDLKKYRRLKNNWKLLLKDKNQLNYQDYKWRRSFRRVLCETEMVEELLSFSEELRRHYELFQDFLWGIRHKDLSEVFSIIYSNQTKINKNFTTVLKSFQTFADPIWNALNQSYSNGPLECFNNHIKVLKRVAYGYRSFKRLKQRIMIVQGKIFPTI